MNKDTRTVSDLLHEWTADEATGDLNEALGERSNLAPGYARVLRRAGIQIQSLKPFGTGTWVDGFWHGEKVGLQIFWGGSQYGIKEGPISRATVGDHIAYYERGWDLKPNPEWKKRLEDLDAELKKIKVAVEEARIDEDVEIVNLKTGKRITVSHIDDRAG